MPVAHTDEDHRRFAEGFAAVIADGFPLMDKVSRAKGNRQALGEYARRHNLSSQAVTLRLARIRGTKHWKMIEKAEAARLANAREKLALRKVNAEARRSRVFLLTAAQDDTPLHEAFWQNLTAYAAFRSAALMVGGFTYQKGLFEDHSVQAGVYDSRIMPFLQPVETRLGPSVIWAGQANILPTAANPLAGWQGHGGHASIILPHAKIALQSVPVMPGNPPKIALSTGVCTLPNYIRRNAGMRAEWHHTIGFAVVEIAADGSQWIRTVSAMKDGSFRDLDLLVAGGKVISGQRVEAITWGDIHHEKIDEAMSIMGWGVDASGRRRRRHSMLDVLRPAQQHFHDLIDFSARNHHNIDDPVHAAAMHAARAESVGEEIAAAARWLRAASRPGIRSVVIDSNHNAALSRWLRGKAGRMDPANSAYYHFLNARWHEAARSGDRSFSPFEFALRHAAPDAEFTFVQAGQSHLVCADGPAIECGLHGHVGNGGARGSLASFARMAPRVNVAHSHSPGIRDAAYQAGTNSLLDMGYNAGPTSWAHADIVTHVTGKRQIIIKNKRGWRL